MHAIVLGLCALLASAPVRAPLPAMAVTGFAPALRYRLAMPRPASHLFEVEIRVEGPETSELVFRMPSWSPGRYLIHDYGWQVQDVEAVDGDGDPLPVDARGEDAWRVDRRGRKTVVFRYRRFANALDCIFSQLDATHASVNGASVFAWVEGMRELPITFEVSRPAEWRIATALPGDPHAGRFRADDYDHLIDSPIEIGEFQEYAFESLGRPVALIVCGAAPEEACRRFAAALAKVCDVQGRMFGGHPFERYVFLVHPGAGGGRTGGLEHRDSTRIVLAGGLDDAKSLEMALSIASHEFFHLWNVKRIRARELVRPDLTAEVDTWSLWIAEGLTSYFGDLALVRAGLVPLDRWLEGLRRKLDEDAAEGHAWSLEETSRRTWQWKEPPEPSATHRSWVNYYRRGEIAGLVLDATLRAATSGRKGLEDVMRLLDERFARRGLGYAPGDFEKLCEEVGGRPLADWFRRHVSGREPMEVAAALGAIGISLVEERAPPRSHLGCRVEGSPPRVVSVQPGSPLPEAGIQEGDVLVSFGGQDLAKIPLEAALDRLPAGEASAVAVRRGPDVITTSLRPRRDAAVRRRIALVEDAPGAMTALRQAWLEGSKP